MPDGLGLPSECPLFLEAKEEEKEAFASKGLVSIEAGGEG